MEQIDLKIAPRFDPAELDRGIAKLKELEAKGFTIPVNFKSNLEALKVDAEALITRLRGQWMGLASDFSSGNAKLLSELDRLGESTAAGRLRRGFASVREEVLVLDNLISQLNLKGDAGAGLAKGLAAGRIADLVKSGRAHGETVSFAGYGEQAERATTAQEKFVAAEVKGVQAAAQSEAALAAESAALKAKGFQFEEARTAAQRFQKTEAEATAQTQRAGQATGADVALQKQRSAALIRNAGSDAALQRQRSAAYLAEQKRAAAEEAAEAKRQQAAMESLQRQRSAALIRQAKEEERAAAGRGLRGLIGTARTAAPFIIAYQGIDVAIQALKAGAEASIEFERKLKTLQILFHGTKEEARALALETLNVAANFGQDGIAALDAAADFSRFGWNASQVLEAVRVSSLAANVAMIDLAESSKNLQAITASFDLNAGQLAGVLAGLNQISNTSAVTVRQLLDAVARVGPIAKQSGISLAEIAGSAGAISAATGRPGQEAGNAIKSLLSRLEKPEVREALQGAGVTLADDRGALKSKSALINEIFLATQRLSAAERERLIITVAGTYQAARIAALMDNYIGALGQAAAFARESQSAERENLSIRESLSSQLGTLKTRWQEFWVAGAGSGAAIGLQSQLTEIVKSLGNMLSMLTALENGFGKVGSSLDQLAGSNNKFGGPGSFIRNVVGFQLNPGKTIGSIGNSIFDRAKELLPAVFVSDAERATKALVEFNKEVARLEGLAEAGRIAEQIFSTLEKTIQTASPEKQQTGIDVAARTAFPDDANAQQGLRAQLSLLVETGKWEEFAKKMAELRLKAHQETTGVLKQSREAQAKELQQQEESLAKLEKEKGKTGASADLDARIKQAKDAIQALKTGIARSNYQQVAEPAEDEPDAKVEKRLKKLAEDQAKLLTAGRPKTTHVAELQEESQQLEIQIQLRTKAIEAARASGVFTEGAAKKAIENLKEETEETRKSIEAKKIYAEVADIQERAARRIKDQTDAYGEATKAIPSVNRADELAAERQVLQIKDDMLRLERAREEPMLRALGLGQAEINVALSNIDAQRELLKVEGERLAQQQRFAAIMEAAKRGQKDAQATNEFFGVGTNESEKRANLIRGLTDRRSGRDLLTGLPLNIAAATADFAGAGDPVEKARALARLKEMAISLQDAENDLVKRRYQIEAEITNERRKQAQEASKNLLMADRETQLRAALAAKFAQARGGRGFTAEEFGFFDTKSKQTIEKTNPELLPPEFQTRLRELQDESTALANAFRPLKEAADAAAAAIAQMRLPTPAINPGNPSAAVSIDVSPVSAAIASSGHGVQTAIDVLGTNMVRQLDSITAALDMVSVNLGTRVARLESGSLTSQIGRAQGAASVLA